MKPAGLVRVLIVDDSVTARLSLRAALESDPGLCVVGEAENGEAALRLARALNPDIVLMDVYLRGENGLDVAAELMATTPCPILAVTAANPADPALVFRGMDVGVLEICLKPPAPDAPAYAEARRRLARLVTVLARVPVVRRFAPRREAARPVLAVEGTSALGVVLMGASTGGPPVVRAILELLPRPFPLPIALVHHMTAGFGRGFATWLGETTGHRVVVVERAVTLEPGVVYQAHDACHLHFTSATTLGPSDEPPVRHQRPSIDTLFLSAARLVRSPTAAVLLTGMGSDGAEGLLALRRAGAVTMVQEPSTCVVDSMPSEAIRLGAAGRALPPVEIAAALSQYSAAAMAKP